MGTEMKDQVTAIKSATQKLPHTRMASQIKSDTQ